MNKYFNYDKVIYQTYECEFSDLHPDFRNTAQKWIDTHPDWTYHFSSAEKRKDEILSILNLSKDAIKAYDSLPGVIQGDIWRFVITGQNSGMYADLDSVPLSNVENVINKLDREVDLISSLDGYQIDRTGSNTSNYVFGKNTFLGKEIVKIVYEHLEISGYMIKNDQPPLFFNTMVMWPHFTNIHKDRIAQIYSPEYYNHSRDYKPPQEWRSKYENKKLGIKTPSPTIYTKEWEMLYKKAISDIS